ncbi:hypothetical protein D1631_05635 [Chryseobacterium nematophagum]|uniref:Uncharacterized protein n=1 Tax=Chryseobacterium nematophagum TaxID=2305228 RepID=A0A3M7TGV6_9FLAO|nr:hypothetical protein D1631_05635 [Chryseobacterium nematophagum]
MSIFCIRQLKILNFGNSIKPIVYILKTQISENVTNPTINNFVPCIVRLRGGIDMDFFEGKRIV